MAEQWWICTDVLARGGKKVMGPFVSQELALAVRAYVEAADKREDLWVDSEESRARAVVAPYPSKRYRKPAGVVS